MMVSARGKECRFPSIALSLLKTEHITVEDKGALQIGHFKVNVTNPRLRSERAGLEVLFHDLICHSLGGAGETVLLSVRKRHTYRVTFARKCLRKRYGDFLNFKQVSKVRRANTSVRAAGP